MYDKRKKERAWLICAAHDTVIDMKGLTKTLGVGSGNLRGGNEDSMWERLGAKAGALTLFAIVNDKDKKGIELILDKRITEDFKYVGFHPMENTATTAISKESVLKVAQLAEHEPKILDFSSDTAAAANKPAAKPKPAKKEGAAAAEGEGKKQ